MGVVRIGRVVEDLGDRVDVPCRGWSSGSAVGERQLDAQDGLHPPVVVLEQLLDGLRLEGDGHRVSDRSATAGVLRSSGLKVSDVLWIRVA